MLAMVIIFAIKNIYIAISFFVQTKISSNIELDITKKYSETIYLRIMNST